MSDYQIKFCYDDNMELKLEYRNINQFGPEWFSYFYESKELVPGVEDPGSIDINNYKLTVNFKSRNNKAPDKSLLPVVKKHSKKIQSYCCIDMRKHNGKMEYRFGYYIQDYLRPLYYIIPYDVNISKKYNVI